MLIDDNQNGQFFINNWQTNLITLFNYLAQPASLKLSHMVPYKFDYHYSVGS